MNLLETKLRELLGRESGFVGTRLQGWCAAMTAVRIFLDSWKRPIRGETFTLCMDGDKWCCVGPDFENLQVSQAGFGDTADEAIADFINDVRFVEEVKSC